MRNITIGRFLTGIFLGLASIAGPERAAAQIGVAIGSEYGLGLVGRVGNTDAIVEVGGGIAPVWVFGLEQTRFGGSDEAFFEAFFAGAAGAKASLPISRSDEGINRLGIELGATYNTLIELGAGIGIDARVSERIVLSGGVMYYFEAEDRLAEEVSERRNAPASSLDLGPLVGYQPYVGLVILLR